MIDSVEEMSKDNFVIEEMLIEFDFLGIPLSKIGIMMGWDSVVG